MQREFGLDKNIEQDVDKFTAELIKEKLIYLNE